MDPITLFGAGSLALGLLNTYAGFSGLSELHKQKMPTYKATPEFLASKARADELARGGYSPAEKAAFEQSLSRSQNTGYQRAVDRAPGMSQEILAGVNYSNISAHNDFAARDASLHRENIRYSDQFSKYMQELNNKNVESQQRQRLMAEQALGQAAQSGLSQIAGGINLNQILNSDLYKQGKINPFASTDKKYNTDVMGSNIIDQSLLNPFG